jgi:hypothetical protein
MPVFKIATPDGRTLSIEAGDEQTALRGAQEWFVGQGKQPKADVNPVGDFFKSAGVGLAQGAIGLAGLPGDLSELGARGLDRAVQGIGSMTGIDVGAPRPDQPTRFGSQDIQGAVEGVTGEFYEPQTTAGEYARTVGEFAPGALAGPGGVATRAMTQAVVPGLLSEAAGQATKGEEMEPYARAGGAVLSAFAPSALRRVVSPLPTNQARADAVDALRNEGVTELTPGQITGRNSLRYFESEKGGATGARVMEAQAEQFTAAALRRAGINANRATPEVIDEAFTRIGGEFDGLAARNNLRFDSRMNQELIDVYDDYTSLVPQSSQAPIIRNTLQDLTNSSAALAQQGQNTFSGASYQALRSRMDKAARALRITDPQAAEALRGIRDALDSAMERSITRSNPQDAGAWREARRQYRNMLVIEDAATGAGENAALGLISPASLKNATKRQGKRAYARGQGEFSELARSGEAIMKPLPQSGTAPRLAAQGLMSGVGALAGGTATGTAEGGALGAIAGLAGPRAAARIAMSQPGRAYLGNQLLANRGGAPLHQLALLEGLLGSNQLRESLVAQPAN